jgi:hypothetical protein
MTAPHNKLVTFIEYDEPPLKAGEYQITVTHTTNQLAPNDKFTEKRQFAVAGERFALGGEIVSVFPPPMANGEFADVLPHVVFSKHTLPWERESVKGQANAPWLAILTFAASELAGLTFPASEQPGGPPDKLTPMKVKDLIPKDKTIGVYGSEAQSGTGTMPAGYLSYPMPDIDQKFAYRLDYGETPEDDCKVLDLPVDLFNQVAPSQDDLAWLAHIREADTTDSEDHVVASLQFSVVVGNRVGPDNEDTYAFLVSLENLGDYLLDAEGKGAEGLKDYQFVRLVVLHTWRYFANEGDAKFTSLVESLNQVKGQQQLSTLRLPCAAPEQSAVNTAMNNQANGALNDDDATALTANAFAMGYVPLDHRLRHAGNLVSWYRGPLAPYAIDSFVEVPQPSADRLARYNPQTGMFDVSYAAAWQLGQLMALQNTGFSTTLYTWKKTLQKAEAAQEELDLLTSKLSYQPDDPDSSSDGDDDNAPQASPAAAAPHAFASLLDRRQAYLNQTLTAIPDNIVDWLAKLRLLNGVPFSYLVPDERILPPESLRFFYLDPNWVTALIDGAFSIGRATVDDIARDAAAHASVHGPAMAAVKTLRQNPRRALVAENSSGAVTGFLLRSQVLKGWPRLQVNGYSDINGDHELDKFRLVRLSDEIMLALFDGELQMVAIHEPPEQLHFGVEGGFSNFKTSLRAVVSASVGSPLVDLHPGEQIPGKRGLPFEALLPTRSDGRTVQVAAAADSIKKELTKDELKQNTDEFRFKSAEFALQMIKGVMKVEFQVSTTLPEGN